MLQGIDISHHNGENILDIVMHNNPIDFVICKATEGATFFDKLFDSNMTKADKYALLRGAYHYVNAPNQTVSGAFMGSEGEAYNFVSHARPYGDCILVLDFEEKRMLKQEGVDYLGNVAQFVKSMTGTPPLIYVSESVVKQFNFSNIVDIGCGLWVAKWKKGYVPVVGNVTADAYVAASSGEFGITAIQQISDMGMVGGKIYNLDVDIANMSVAAWRKYANPRL